MDKFKITKDHIKLAKKLYVGWNDCEFGAPEIDPKRPYGNSFVEGDIAEILGWDVDGEEGLTTEQEQKAVELHMDMQKVLQYLLKNADKFIKAPIVVNAAYEN